MPGPVAFARSTRSVGSRPDAHRVHERVRGVGVVEDGLAADVRDADRVAVVGDPGDGAPEVPVGSAEAQAVEQRDRPRAHRDDVANDPADPGRRSLERLDRARMVVRLDLERDGDSSPRSITPAFSPGPCRTRSPPRGQAPQQPRRVLVAAVLRPEDGEDGELEVVRLAPEQLADTTELPVGETERAMEWLLNGRSQGAQCTDVLRTSRSRRRP